MATKRSNKVGKTRKSIAKRFKVTAGGKVVASRAGRRHIASTKNRKRMRRLGSAKVLGKAETTRVKKALHNL